MPSFLFVFTSTLPRMDVNYEYLISSYSPFLVGVETWKILLGRLKKIVRNWRINNWSSSVLITLVVGFVKIEG